MYKACKNSIVMLEPLVDTIDNEKRNGVADPIHAKFRCDRAKVISIINVETGEEMDQDKSIYDENFIYKKNEIVSCGYFDLKINIICGTGIHYFKTHEAALSWFYCQGNSIIMITFPNGPRVGWYENGNKKFEGSYKNGVKDGE